MDTFVRASARKWASRGVRASVLATGWIKTPMIEGIEPAKKRKIMRAIGTGRWGTVDEVARATEWFLTDAPDYFSAEVFPMSGGL
jgi:3-oxoacyl-[acyl-carrier protein] reductase